MKLEKISNNVLYAVCGVIVLVFLLFFMVGYNNFDEAGNVAPKLTNLLMGLMYLLGVVTFCLMVWSLVKSARNAAGSDEKESTGIPGSKIVMCTAVITIVAFILGWVLNIGEEPFTTSSGVTTSGTMVTMVDAFMVAIYILAIVSIIAVIVAGTGVMTKTATKK